MIFGFLFKKEPRVPLSAGELLEIKIPVPKSPGTEESFRYLYGKILKISKKRNIFVTFTSRDRGEHLEVGTDVILSAVKPKKVIRFPSKFLHQNDETFIFSPPVTMTQVGIPDKPEKAKFQVTCPIEYRSFNTMHLQKGVLHEISERSLSFGANLLIPIGTRLSLEFFLPYRERPIRITGKVLSAERDKNSSNHHIVFSIEEISKDDRAGLLHFALLRR